MKKILFFAALLFAGTVSAQTGYTTINNRYSWLAGQFNNGFNPPAGTTPALFTGQSSRFGGLYADSTGGNKGYHYYNGSGWIRLVDTTMSSFFATPTWQQTLTAGADLSSSITSNRNSNNFLFYNGTAGAGLFLGSTGGSLFTAVGGDNNYQSYFTYPDSAVIYSTGTIRQSWAGATYKIYSLANTSTQDRLVGQVGGTGQVGYLTIASPLNITSGVLGITASAITMPINGLLAATGSNIINNANTSQQWQWNTLGATYGLLLSSSSTAAASDLQILFSAQLSGANSNSGQDTYAGMFQNNHTGTGAVNNAIQASATGGATNNAILLAGGDLATNQTTQNVFNTTATTVNAFGAATNTNLFAAASGGLLNLQNTGNAAGLVFYEPSASGTNTTTIKAQTQAGNITYILPSADAAGVLTSNGSGSLSWVAAFALTNGNGTTANGTAVDLGGTVSGAVAIDDASAGTNNFDIGRVTEFSRVALGAATIEVTGSTSISLIGAFTQITGTDFRLPNYSDGTMEVATGVVITTSDMNLKNSIGDYNVGLKEILKLQPSLFRWNHESSNSKLHPGFIAQDIRDAFGEQYVSSKNGILSYSDKAIIGALVNAVKEQQKEIETLKLKIK